MSLNVYEIIGAMTSHVILFISLRLPWPVQMLPLLPCPPAGSKAALILCTLVRIKCSRCSCPTSVCPL